MTRLQLADSDKAAIRDLTEEAIANGVAGKALAALRRELASTLGANPASVRSVSSYTTFDAGQAIDECGLSGRLSTHQLLLAARLVRGSPTALQDVAALAADFGVEAADLQRAIFRYERSTLARTAGCIVTDDGSAPAAQPDRCEGDRVSPNEAATRDLAKDDIPLVYGELLRTLLDRGDLVATKALLVDELGCSKKAIDGVQAQLTKDIGAVYSAVPEVQQWGEPLGVLRLTACHFGSVGAGTSDPFESTFEPLEGTERFLRDFRAVCHRRGVGILWEEKTGGFARWGSAAEQRAASEYRGAAHADFDFPAKIAWRVEWERFLTEKLSGLPREVVARMKVLCFPSKDPRREIPIYLRLGIRPENIVAVEGDKDAAVELKRNLRLLGGDMAKVRVEATDLLRFLKREREVFDIVSLDFHGPAGFDKAEIYRFLRVAPTHYVLLNLEAAREKPLGQRLLREMHMLQTRPGAFFSDFGSTICDPRNERWTVAPGDTGETERDFCLDSIGLRDARESYLPYIRDLGYGYWSNAPRLEKRLKRYEDLFEVHGPVGGFLYPHAVTPQGQLDALARKTCAVVARLLTRAAVDAADPLSLSSEEVASCLFFAFLRAVYPTTKLDDLRKFVYRSAASHVGQPYLSWFCTLSRRDRCEPAFQRVGEFVLDQSLRRYELATIRRAEKIEQAVVVADRRSRTGHLLFIPAEGKRGADPVQVGDPLSSAEIGRAIVAVCDRTGPDDVRERQLLQLPRVVLSE